MYLTSFIDEFILRFYSGPRFRKHRRFIQQTFNQRAVTALRPLQEEETLKLLIGLTHSPGRISQHLRRCALSVNQFNNGSSSYFLNISYLPDMQLQ